MINKNILKQVHHHGFDDEELYKSYKIFFGTLVSESRLKIINILRKGEKNVSEIMKELKMDQTTASHNLKRLKTCGFVKSKVKGKFRYYKLNQESIKPLMEIIEKHMSEHCIHILKDMELKKGEK